MIRFSINIHVYIDNTTTGARSLFESRRSALENTDGLSLPIYVDDVAVLDLVLLHA